MTDILHVDSTDPVGKRLLEALRTIETGVGELQMLADLAANAIAANDSAVTMEEAFGIPTGEGQAMADRLGLFQTGWAAGGGGLRDLVSAVRQA